MKKGFEYTGVAIVFACHDGNGNYLFAKRSTGARDGHGCWEIPAGGLKFGERIIDGLHRELKEELCVEPISVEYIGYKEVIQKDGDAIVKHWVNFQFHVLVDSDDVAIGEPDKCDAIEWRKLNSQPQPLHFGVKETMDDIHDFLESKK